MNGFDFSLVKEATDARIARGILPGAVLCVNIEGKRVYEYCAGYSDVENKTPLRKDAIFRLASMTKPIAVAAVLREQDAGRLSVKDNVSKYIPAFAQTVKVGKLDEHGNVVFDKKAARELTVEDLLTHGSGLGAGPVGDKQLAEGNRTHWHTLEEAAAGYAKWYLDFSPCTSQFYSALTALDVAARIVEITSGQSYEAYLKEHIFAPLGMKDTTYHLRAEQKTRLVPMYRLSDAADGITPEPHFGYAGHDGFPEGCESGCTCLFSTMEDYSKFAEMLCGEGETNGVRILSREAVRAMRTPYFEDGFAGMNPYFIWGYAVRVRCAAKDGEQELTPGSYGWSGAFNTHFWVDPARKLTAVYMSNLNNAGGAGAVTAFEFECNVMRSLKKE